MNKSILIKLFLSFIFCWSFQVDGTGQCPGPLFCNGNLRPEVEIEITVLEEPAVCGEQGRVRVRVTNHTGNPVTFPCGFQICLDEPGESDILFTGLDNGSPPAFTGQGNGTSHGTVNTGNFQLPDNSTVQFFFTMKGSCELMDLLANGSTDEFENNIVNVFSCYSELTPGQALFPVCFNGESESFNIEYNLIAVEECNTTQEVNIGIPFDMEYNFAVTGDYCVDGFEITAEFDPSIDLTGFVPYMSAFNNSIGVGINNVDIDFGTNTVYIDVGLPWAPAGTQYCADDFNGTFSNLTLLMTGLVLQDCDTPIPVTVSTNSCSFAGHDPTCYDPDGTLAAQSSATCFLSVPLGDPNLSLVDQLAKGGLDFCDGTAAIQYNIDHSSSTDPEDNALNLDLAVTHWSWMTVHGVFVGGTYYAAGTQPSWIEILGTTVNFNFGDDTDGDSGLVDLDGDGAYDDLPIDDDIFVRIRISSGCPFTGDVCQSNLDQYAYFGTLRWDNQCETNPESTSAHHRVTAEGGPGYFSPLPGPIVEPEFSVNFCVSDSWICTGMENSPFDMSNFTITFESDHTIFPKGEFTRPFLTALTYTDVNGEEIRLEKNADSPADAPSFTFASMPSLPCMDLHLSIDCPPEGGIVPVLVEFSASGTWEECPDCEKKLGCASTTVLVNCPCTVEPCPEGCEYVTSESLNIERVAPSGGNTGAAYMCDQVDITIKGSMVANYSGNIYGCYGFYGGTPNFFDAPTAEVWVNGTFVGTANSTGSANIPLGGSTSLDFYTYAYNGNFPAGATIEFIINTTVSQSAINTLSPGVHPVPIFGALGEEAPDGSIRKCGLLADYFNFYKIGSQFDHPHRTFQCSSDTIKVPFQLEFIGGTGGDDFPNEDRPVNQITDFTLSVANSNFTIVGIQIDGNAPLTGTSFSNIENLIPPNDKVGNPGVSQEFDIILLGSCLASGGSSVTVEGSYEENIHDTNCTTNHSFSETASFGYQNGGLSTEALNTPINTVQRCIVVETQTKATNYSAHAAWLQFEYDPTIIESITALGPNAGAVNVTPGSTTIWSMEFSTTITETQWVDANFEICFNDACDAQPITIPYWVGKVCEPDDIPTSPVPHTDNSVCFESMDAFVVSFEESGLNMNVNQCNEAGGKDACEEIYYSVTLENLAGAGNTGDVHFGIDLPAGFEIVSLAYSYPFNSNSSCSGAQCTGANDISNLIGELTSTDGIDLGANGILPGAAGVAVGELPGVQSGMANEYRRVNFCVSIRPTCDSDPSSDDLVFFSNGRRPCGALIELQNNQFQDILDDWYLDFDASIALQQEVKIDCKTGEGAVYLAITWPPNLMLPQGQTVFLTGNSSTNINVNFPIQITVSNFPSPQIVEIPFTFDPSISCTERAKIGVELNTHAELECGDQVCTFDKVLDEDDLIFGLNNGWVFVSDLEIDENLCPEDDITQGEITFTLENFDAPAGKPFTASYFCDADEDGVPDGPAFATVNGFLPGPNSTTTVVLAIAEADFWAACPDGKIMATIEIDASCCICIRGTLAAEICCECPEFEFNYTWLGGNTFEFYVQPDGYISLLYCWHAPNGDDVFVSTTDNPFIINFDDYGYVPDEVCVRIESDYLEDCEDPELIKFNPLRTDPPCSEKYCRPMKDCYADLEIGCVISDPIGGSADITLTADIQTNMTNLTISWQIDGVFAGSGSPFTTTLSAGYHEVCLHVSGWYMGKYCKFKTCKRVFIEDDCEGLELDAGYDYKIFGPNPNFSYNMTVFPNVTDPAAQHEWYLATSSEGCEIGKPLSVQYGPNPTFTLQPCVFYILIHKVTLRDCEACFKRCFWICEGAVQDLGGTRAPFDCSTLERYNWPASKPNVSIFIDAEETAAIPNEIIVRPNPADDYVNISWNMDNATQISVYDLSGKMIIQEKLNQDTRERRFETSTHRPGIYLVKVISSEGEFVIKKFEVLH